jgi:hypothetical protein
MMCVSLRNFCELLLTIGLFALQRADEVELDTFRTNGDEYLYGDWGSPSFSDYSRQGSTDNRQSSRVSSQQNFAADGTWRAPGSKSEFEFDSQDAATRKGGRDAAPGASKGAGNVLEDSSDDETDDEVRACSSFKLFRLFVLARNGRWSKPACTVKCRQCTCMKVYEVYQTGCAFETVYA